jgi:hypothetical protein
MLLKVPLHFHESLVHDHGLDPTLDSRPDHGHEHP